MKRQNLLLAAILFATVSAFGATDYGLTVGGVDVTSDNCSNITGEHIKKHSSATDDEYYIKYVPSTKTLTFKNIQIERSGSYNRAILNEDVDGLKIVFIGENTLKAEDSSPVRLNNNTTITVHEGSGLIIRGGDEDGITVGDGKTLIFDNAYYCSVGAENSNAIEGATGKESLIIRNNSYVSASTYLGDHGLYDFASLSVSDSWFVLDGGVCAIKDLDSFTHNGAYPLVLGAKYNAETKKFDGNSTKIIAGVDINDETLFDADFSQACKDYAPDNFRDGHYLTIPFGYATESYSVGSITQWKELNLSGKSLKSLKGIDFFLYLQTLNCYNNQLTGVDLSKNVNLTSLYLNYNSLSTIDLSKNVNLTSLYLNHNSLSTIDLSKNVKLEYLYLQENSLLTIDLSKNTLLKSLSINDNKLESLDLKNNGKLETCYAYNNLLTSINLNKNVALTFLNIDDNRLETLDLTNNINLKTVYCENNNLTKISTPHSSFAIEKLDCSDNNLTELNLSLSGTSKFEYLNCSGNAINGDAAQRFVDNLPTPSASNNAELVFTTSSATDKNSMTQAQVLTAISKNWRVTDIYGNAYLGEQSTSIESIETDAGNGNAPRYNLMGQPVDKNYRGVVIQNGKKTLIK